MKDKYTAQAATTEEAIAKGLKALGISRDNADISITQESKKGFLGIGQRDAVVVVKRKNAKNAVQEFVTKEMLLNEDKESTIKMDEKPSKPVVEPVAESPEKVLEAKEEAKDETQEEETEEAAGTKTADQKPSEMKKDDSGEKQDKDDEPKDSKPVRKEVVLNETDEKAIQSVADYLQRITDKMGVEDVTITVKRNDRRVQYVIDTEDAGLIIGRHGKVLNSLQTLAQIQLHQEADNKLYAKVDAENYRDRRQKTVEQLATRTAEKVRRTKRPVILEPMPAHERKQIHRFLNQHKGVQTHSEGKEPHRYLVVEPSKEDEFKI
ncbi:RNA-binding cell elongation regulator Jag/EloR [Alkalibacterium sp.]|nr:MAG: protein jag [Alkalibacterium sp.]